MTKLRRLPEIDLARIAPLGRAEKLVGLRSFNSGGGSWSYGPARRQNLNVASPRDPMGLAVLSPPIDKIRELVRKDCSCDVQEKSCIEVVDLFHGWIGENVTDSVERKMPSMAIGSLGVVRYWEDFVCLVDGRPTQIFLDHRRQRGLTRLARKFVFSMMAAQAASADPDLLDAKRLVLSFPQSKAFPRRIFAHFCGDDDLFSVEQLTSMIEETYELWQIVLNERKVEPPKRASGGGFGF